MPPVALAAWTVRSKPDPVDVHVGGRLRQRRQLLGLSQGEVGARLGFSFQQIQKYERGTSRIGASRLYRLSKVWDVPVDFSYGRYGRPGEGAGPEKDEDKGAYGRMSGMGGPGVPRPRRRLITSTRPIEKASIRRRI